MRERRAKLYLAICLLQMLNGQGWNHYHQFWHLFSGKMSEGLTTAEHDRGIVLLQRYQDLLHDLRQYREDLTRRYNEG